MKRSLLPISTGILRIAHYGCIDLTDVSSPKFKVSDCTGIAPGTYRLYITYEGKNMFYSFKVRGETDE